MAVNSQQRSGLLQVVTDPAAGTGVQRIAPRSADWRMPSSGVEEAFASTERAASKISDELADVGREIGKYADHAARIEGERAGHQAGMNPDFQPTRAITIRGEAYDKAGLETYKSQVSVEIENDIQAGGNLAKKRDAWLARVPEELRPDVAYVFRRGELAQARTAAREHQARISAEATAALQTELDTELKGLHQRAYALGNDPTADQVLGRDIARIDALLARKGVDGKPLADAGAAEKIRRQAKEAVVEARILGEFDRLPDNAQRLSFIDRIDQDFRNSEGLSRHLDLKEYQRITGKLRAEFRAAQFEERQSQAAVDGEVKALGAMVEKGYLPTDAQLAGARGRAAAVKNPALADRMAVIEDTLAFQRDARSLPPEAIDGYARSLRAAMAEKGPTPEGIARVELAEKLAHEARTQLKADPLGWADRVGLVKLAPLDLSDQAKTEATLKMRIAQAEQTAAHYGQPPQYLRPDEKRKLATIAAQGGEKLMGMASSLTAAAAASGNPDRAGRIMAEIADHGPTAAMIGGLVTATSGIQPPPVARDAADGLALLKTDGHKSRAPTPLTSLEQAKEVTRGALRGLPQTEQAAIAAANAAYDVRAQRLGLKEFDDKLWRRTFSEVLGERTIGNEVYGGIAYAKTGSLWGGSGGVVVPPNVKRDAFHDLIRSITPDDLGTAWPKHQDGRPVDVADFRRATLVPDGNGTYQMNIGDETRPLLLRSGTDSKEPFVLDLNALEPKLRQRYGDKFYLGGAPVPENGGQRPAGMMKLGGLVPNPGQQELPGAYDSGAHDDFGAGKFARLKDINTAPDDYIIKRNYNRTLTDVVGPGGERWTVDEFTNTWENLSNPDAYATKDDLAAAIRAGKVKKFDQNDGKPMYLGGPKADPTAPAPQGSLTEDPPAPPPLDPGLPSIAALRDLSKPEAERRLDELWAKSPTDMMGGWIEEMAARLGIKTPWERGK